MLINSVLEEIFSYVAGKILTFLENFDWNWVNLNVEILERAFNLIYVQNINKIARNL